MDMFDEDMAGLDMAGLPMTDLPMADLVSEESGMVILCAASAYNSKYYFNPDFAGLPESIKEDLQILCVLYTSDVGGILTLQFDDRGNLLFHVTSEENDYFFDEIGSVLKIKQIQREKQELLEALELYYRAFFLNEDISGLLEDKE